VCVCVCVCVYLHSSPLDKGMPTKQGRADDADSGRVIRVNRP